MSHQQCDGGNIKEKTIRQTRKRRQPSPVDQEIEPVVRRGRSRQPNVTQCHHDTVKSELKPHPQQLDQLNHQQQQQQLLILKILKDYISESVEYDLYTGSHDEEEYYKQWLAEFEAIKEDLRPPLFVSRTQSDDWLEKLGTLKMISNENRIESFGLEVANVVKKAFPNRSRDQNERTKVEVFARGLDQNVG